MGDYRDTPLPIITHPTHPALHRRLSATASSLLEAFADKPATRAATRKPFIVNFLLRYRID
ncbi:hypothetical protein [Neoroseomonas rubea]|uniref:hypothetical protein n=1 Tax=Neoroseomonas rubea TaxID=2748666 RepID=UPI0018DFC869|nr:hypothetical protein [Roseomonas rubea]